MIDKSYCMSSFLSLRYVEDDNKQFFDGLKHQVYKQKPMDYKVFVSNAQDVDIALRNVFRRITHEKLGMLLSGGMDSSILASYMPEGSNAYTFRFLGGKYQSDELERAVQGCFRHQLDGCYCHHDLLHDERSDRQHPVSGARAGQLWRRQHQRLDFCRDLHHAARGHSRAV